MRIAVFATMFPAWSETFVRREVRALASRGHEVRVFAGRPPIGPETPGVPGVEVRDWEHRNVADFAPDVLYGQLGWHAQQRAVAASRELDARYALRLWSGVDSFGLPARCKPLYQNLGRDPRCRAVLVEDSFMADFARGTIGVTAPLVVVPNSLEVERFAVDAERRGADVLAIARFVPKKGLHHLLNAVRATAGVTLRLYGDGPERALLERVACDRVVFSGTCREEELPAIYASAGIYAAPCVRPSNGDGDGVPTTVLEAMASGMPVVASDLLSMPCYVRSGETGLLVPPANEAALAAALARLRDDAGLRARLGASARAWARENLDVSKNVVAIEEALS